MLCDNPQAIVTVTLARLCRVNRIRRKDTLAKRYCFSIAFAVIGTDSAPVPADVALKAPEKVRLRNGREDSGSCDNLSQGEQAGL